MLVLERHMRQRIRIGKNIWVSVVRIRSEGRVRIAIEAPKDVPIVREELIQESEEERTEAA